MASPLTNAVAGAALLPRALRLLAGRPRLLLLGALPPLIASVVFLGLLILLLASVMAISEWLTGFADTWSPGVVEALRLLVAGAILVVSVLVMVVAFSTVTLTVGAPIYDRISERTEDLIGAEVDAPEEPLRVTLPRSVRQSLALVLISLGTALPIFLLGVVPVVGTVLGPVVSACFGGWMIATEMVGSGLERRGRPLLKDRWALMRAARARTLGFGVPVFLLLSLPLVAIVVFPIAASAGTMLARDLVGAPSPRPDVDRG